MMDTEELSLKFSTSFTEENDQFFVFEANEDVVNSLQKGQNMTIKSYIDSFDCGLTQNIGEDADSEAFLCTADKTYLLRRNDYTNLFLFTDNGKGTGKLDFEQGLDQVIISESTTYLLC